jgi:hypothetical protein
METNKHMVFWNQFLPEKLQSVNWDLAISSQLLAYPSNKIFTKKA